MREIKYRIYNKWQKKMFDVYQIDFDCSLVLCSHISGSRHTFCMKDSILIQFTGIYDKNNTPIYEGDIIQTGSVHVFLQDYHSEKNPNQAMQEIEIGRVEYVGSSYVFLTENYTDGYPLSTLLIHKNRGGLLVIGNIYENPELLTNK